MSKPCRAHSNIAACCRYVDLKAHCKTPLTAGHAAPVLTLGAAAEEAALLAATSPDGVLRIWQTAPLATENRLVSSEDTCWAQGCQHPIQQPYPAFQIKPLSTDAGRDLQAAALMEIRSPQQCTAACFPAGSALQCAAAYDDGALRLFDLPSASISWTATDLHPVGQAVVGLHANSDGTRLLSVAR